jgi:PASTA domain
MLVQGSDIGIDRWDAASVPARILPVGLTAAALFLSGCGGSSSPPNPHTTVVPNVVGTSFVRAWAILSRSGLCVTRVTTEWTTAGASDHIVRQLPKAGARVSTPGAVTLFDDIHLSETHPSKTGTETATAPLFTTTGGGPDCPAPVPKFSHK